MQEGDVMIPKVPVQSKVHLQRQAGFVVGLVLAIVLGAVPATANLLGSASLDGFGRYETALDQDEALVDCDALRRDAQLRNTLRPSRRRALIRACEAHKQEIWVAGGPVSNPTDRPPL
jgi:hypothetical protein